MLYNVKQFTVNRPSSLNYTKSLRANGPKGGNMSKQYEVAFLLRESEHVAAMERIKAAVSKVEAEVVAENTKMGVRELAYVIAKNREKFQRAFYYFINIQATPEQITGFEELIKYDQGIIRRLVNLEN
ncbi:MAG: 30S ribosomal protein S6 [Brevinemataceae bacterium]